MNPPLTLPSPIGCIGWKRVSEGRVRVQRFRSRLRFAALGAALALIAGCASPRSDSSTRVRPEATAARGAINELNLLAIPVALNFDQLPGLDGFVIKVYAGNVNRPEPVPIENGKLEVLMFDGILKEGSSTSLQPRKTWTFTAAQLRRYEIKTSIGPSYELKPEWGEAKPKSDRISVVARFVPPEGRVVYSAPSVISVSGN